MPIFNEDLPFTECKLGFKNLSWIAKRWLGGWVRFHLSLTDQFEADDNSKR